MPLLALRYEHFPIHLYRLIFSFTLIQMELCHELLNNIHRPVTLLQLFISFLNKILGTSGFFCDAADPIGRLFYHSIDICYGTADLTDMFLQFFHCVFGFLHNIPEGVRIHVILLPHWCDLQSLTPTSVHSWYMYPHTPYPSQKHRSQGTYQNCRNKFFLD